MKQVSTSLLENSKGAISNSTPTNNISEILKNSTTVINPQQDNEQADLIAARDAFIEDYIREHTPTDKRISLESYNFIRKAAENEWETLNQNKAPSINEYGAHAQGSLRDYLQDSGVNEIIQEKIKFLEDLQILTKLLAYEGLASYSYVLSRKTAEIPLTFSTSNIIWRANPCFLRVYSFSSEYAQDALVVGISMSLSPPSRISFFSPFPQSTCTAPPIKKTSIVSGSG